MSRDYNKTKPKARKSSSRQKPQNTGGKYPILLLLFAIMGIGAFGYFLWSIKDSAETAPTIAEVKKTPPKKVKKDDLPPKPKDEWEYQNLLENQKIEVDVPKKEVKPKRPYQMQCGSFRTEAQADSLKANIAFQGLEAEVRKVKGKTGTWYKVVLGPYPHKRAAERQRHKLQRGNINGCQIWFWES
ncbi:sporulation protein [Parashewanella spongiae]|uniref:Sporulation protein n=1 Tax=Parashewanella spongiae TaxID=342950 RepID=A0A3A6TY81_9GAMM|nr:SPOR domain-containing protein [Parashewanella spongiae]MCL1079201.1 SPOR domain-containing protein [Parashewanella spongiae]RJY17861.1 sporulation protein [Parashewanella spongiae]